MAEETVVNGVTSDHHHHVVVDDDDDRKSAKEEETITKRDRDLDLRKDSEISELKKKIEGLEKEKSRFVNEFEVKKGSEISELKKKIEGLEKEKSGFVTENQVKNEKIKVLSDEIEGLKKREGEMKKEIAKSEDDKKALQAIMSRAADLETEVSRLQHDLISTMSENEETRGELQRIKHELEVFKQSVRERDAGIEMLEKEKVSLQKKIDEIVQESKAKNDVRSRDLVDRDTKFKEKETEYVLLQKMMKKAEMEKSSLEEELKISEEKFKEIESKVKILEIEVELSEKVINELKEKNAKLIDAEKNAKLIDAEKGNGNGCSKLQWPACAIASTGTVAAAAAAVCYFTYAKRR